MAYLATKISREKSLAHESTVILYYPFSCQFHNSGTIFYLRISGENVDLAKIHVQDMFAIRLPPVD
jgi:hypothetical protein